MTLTYLGAERCAQLQHHGPGQGEPGGFGAISAASLGARGIRVNGISAGPIKTLAAAASGQQILKFVEEHGALRRNVTTEDVGNAAAFLLSDLAAAITGEIIYVDAGFSHVGRHRRYFSPSDSPA